MKNCSRRAKLPASWANTDELSTKLVSKNTKSCRGVSALSCPCCQAYSTAWLITSCIVCANDARERQAASESTSLSRRSRPIKLQGCLPLSSVIFAIQPVVIRHHLGDFLFERGGGIQPDKKSHLSTNGPPFIYPLSPTPAVIERDAAGATSPGRTVARRCRASWRSNGCRPSYYSPWALPLLRWRISSLIASGCNSRCYRRR